MNDGIPSVSDQATAEKEDFFFREFLLVALKHPGLMVSVFVFTLGIALAYVVLAPRIWGATATVKLPDASSGSEALQQVMSLSFSTDPVETYMEVAKSFNVTVRAARTVDLTATAEYSKFANLTQAAEALQKSLTITNVKDSNILAFTVRAHDRGLAVRLADALAQGFIAANLDFVRTGASSRRVFIESQMVQVKADLAVGEEALEHLSEKQGVVHASASNAGEGLDPALGLETRLEDLMMQRSQLSSLYNSNYPQLKAVDAEYRAALAQLNKMPANEMAYQRLARDVKAYETVYDFLLEKDQEARITENSDDSGIVIVDQALPPRIPVEPQSFNVMLLAFLIGLSASVSAGYGMERWLDNLGDEVELARVGGLPVLALIPDWRKETLAPGVELASVVAGADDDALGLSCRPEFKHTYFNESFRSLRTNLEFSNVDRKVRAFSVLSASPDEGKTLVNANLAIALAATGNKVLLVDADLRKPSLHKLFGLEVRKEQGLPLLLSGQVPNLEAHLSPGPVPGLWLLLCGVLPPNPSELLDSDSLTAAVGLMKERFDRVVFDSAPVLPITDAVVLAARLDGVAVLAKFESTRRTDLRRALAALAAVRAPVLGTILNRVDMNKYAYAYGYGSRYYSYRGTKQV